MHLPQRALTLAPRLRYHVLLLQRLIVLRDVQAEAELVAELWQVGRGGKSLRWNLSEWDPFCREAQL